MVGWSEGRERKGWLVGLATVGSGRKIRVVGWLGWVGLFIEGDLLLEGRVAGLAVWMGDLFGSVGLVGLVGLVGSVGWLGETLD